MWNSPAWTVTVVYLVVVWCCLVLSGAGAEPAVPARDKLGGATNGRAAMADGEITAGLRAALEREDASLRLRAAMDAGTRPNDVFIDVLVARCAVEPDFFVRDMLTWALTRHDSALVVAAILPELGSPFPQARSQGLHTLSKIGDPATWSAITPALLHDEETPVARAAWRAAAGLVPDAERADLASALAVHLGRGDGETQRSLARAYVMIGEAARPVIERASSSDDEAVRAHAHGIRALLDDLAAEE